MTEMLFSLLAIDLEEIIPKSTVVGSMIRRSEDKEVGVELDRDSIPLQVKIIVVASRQLKVEETTGRLHQVEIELGIGPFRNDDKETNRSLGLLTTLIDLPCHPVHHGRNEGWICHDALSREVGLEEVADASERSIRLRKETGEAKTTQSDDA